MRRASPHTQYKLSYLDGKICALGPDRILAQLASIPGSGWRLHAQGNYVQFEATRWGFMVAEAVAAPVFVAPEYAYARRLAMKPAPDDLYSWRLACPNLARMMMAHQEEFCAMAYGRRGAMNASEQGTGKTAASCALIAAWSAQRTLVVCPKSLIRQWQEEYIHTVSGGDVDVIPFDADSIKAKAMALSALSEVDGNLCAIINYEILVDMVDVIVEDWRPSVVVFDESWRMKSPRAKVTKAAMAVVRDADKVVLNTGTPIGQDVGDLWSQLMLIRDRGEDMLSYTEFMDAHAKFASFSNKGRRVVKVTGIRDPVGLIRAIHPYYYRATKESCLDLPARLPIERVMLDLTPEVRKLYNSVEKDGETALGDEMSLMGKLSTKLRLQQIAGGFCYNPDGTRNEDWQAAAADLERDDSDIRLRLVGSPKMDWLLNLASDELDGNPSMRVIVWYMFNSEVAWNYAKMRALLGERRVAAVTGKTTPSELEHIKSSFNSREPDGVQVIHAQIKKLAYGHNLQAADVMVYYSHTWSHIEKSQSWDRNHRIGRTAPVRTIELVARRTVDQEVLDATDNLTDMSDRLTPDTVGGIDVQP